MNSSWDTIYDEMKDRRYGRLFFTTLLMVLGIILLIGGLHLNSEEARDACLVILPITLLITTVLVVKWVREERRFRRERLRLAALSRDELAKARLKLKRQAKPMRFKAQARPMRQIAPRVTDTYLKY
jgi:hypothetical protein